MNLKEYEDLISQKNQELSLEEFARWLLSELEERMRINVGLQRENDYLKSMRELTIRIEILNENGEAVKRLRLRKDTPVELDLVGDERGIQVVGIETGM